MSTTIGRVVKLPTPDGGANDLAADYLPVDGVMQLAASNATHLARTNALRGLWERGGGEVWVDRLDEELRWDDTTGVLAFYGGAHLVQPYGETGQWPRLTVRAYVEAPATYTVGMVVVVLPRPGHPAEAVLRGIDTTTSTTATDIDVSLDLARAGLPVRVGETGDESGDATEIHFFVGFWCTSDSGASKATVHSVSAHLEAP